MWISSVYLGVKGGSGGGGGGGGGGLRGCKCTNKNPETGDF